MTSMPIKKYTNSRKLWGELYPNDTRKWNEIRKDKSCAEKVIECQEKFNKWKVSYEQAVDLFKKNNPNFVKRTRIKRGSKKKRVTETINFHHDNVMPQFNALCNEPGDEMVLLKKSVASYQETIEKCQDDVRKAESNFEESKKKLEETKEMASGMIDAYHKTMMHIEQLSKEMMSRIKKVRYESDECDTSEMELSSDCSDDDDDL